MIDWEHKRLELAQKSSDSQSKAHQAYLETMSLFDKIDEEISLKADIQREFDKMYKILDDNDARHPWYLKLIFTIKSYFRK